MANATRRSGNYNPTLWDDDFLQSITIMLGKHIHKELKQTDKILEDLFNMVDEMKFMDLNATSLSFRLLRQHGFLVPQEVFVGFMDEKAGKFKNSFQNDVKGLLSLYEASNLSMKGETIMDAARDFAIHNLKEIVKKQENLDKILASEINHTLELPLHWRMLRLEARWFIDVYETMHDMNPILLEFAKLDFNMVQAMYQEELKQLSRWYTNTKLAEKMSFARDRLVESFLWTIGFTFEPRFRYCRIMSVKLAILITIIDDIYDVYGTLDELELFTHAVDRWDINALKQLPDYMKICFFALFNSMNELAYDVLKVQDFNSISYLKTMWAELCKSYLLEAKWCSRGDTPSLNEFLENAIVSITGPLILGHTYFCITNPIKEKALEDLVQLPALIRWTSLIARLTDDLGTSPYPNFPSSDFFSPFQKKSSNSTDTNNLSHLVFGLVGSENAWHYRKSYIESWWKPNVTRGFLFLDKAPTAGLLPWSQASPPYKVSDDLTVFLNKTDVTAQRIINGIKEAFRELDHENLRWLVMGDDDSIFFLENIVDVLAKYDHTKYYYFGGNSEFILSNYWYSFNQGFGGAGFILSYPLAKALAEDMENCLRRYRHLNAADQTTMSCIADIGVSLTPLKGIHQGNGYNPPSYATQPKRETHHEPSHIDNNEKQKGNGYTPPYTGPVTTQPRKETYYEPSHIDNNEKYKGNGYTPPYSGPVTTQPRKETYYEPSHIDNNEKYKGNGYTPPYSGPVTTQPRKETYYEPSHIDNNEKYKGNGYTPPYSGPVTTQPRKERRTMNHPTLITMRNTREMDITLLTLFLSKHNQEKRHIMNHPTSITMRNIVDTQIELVR
ncbi:hypothetical protein RD792_003164 [Penstemon davidsonii]|uniref:Uncharacterized protein n=1 Tax=Penstemon davidsonii TaxID=160366 RepID=A0ABR0DTJ4_9LAMI|nr:hypothetical protein RD792_003164 [Penstemon davidsonii]